MNLFEQDPLLLRVARRVTASTGAPVVGGVAVFLHGYRRTTLDVDLYAADTDKVGAALREIGAEWSPQRREFLFEGVPVHLVTDREVGQAPAQTVTIDGVLVVGLADLMRMKLASGVANPARAKDLADAVELIRAVQLGKEFASGLPPELRADFRKLVDAVQND